MLLSVYKTVKRTFGRIARASFVKIRFTNNLTYSLFTLYSNKTIYN